MVISVKKSLSFSVLSLTRAAAAASSPLVIFEVGLRHRWRPSRQSVWGATTARRAVRAHYSMQFVSNVAGGAGGLSHT